MTDDRIINVKMTVDEYADIMAAAWAWGIRQELPQVFEQIESVRQRMITNPERMSAVIDDCIAQGRRVTE